jgi:hypothetical protein
MSDVFSNILCVFCGENVGEFGGNSPVPLKDFTERCCDSCNFSKVIPARYEAYITKKKTYPLAKKEGACLINAYVNQREQYRDLDLKIETGSISLNGWFKHGGENWTDQDFALTHRPHPSNGIPFLNFHAWLEDKDGNIYDTIFETDSSIAYTKTGNPLSDLVVGVIICKSKQFMLEGGVKYVKSSKKTRNFILDCFQQVFCSVDKELEGFHTL